MLWKIYFSLTTYIQTCYMNPFTPRKYLQYSTSFTFNRKLHHQKFLMIMRRSKVSVLFLFSFKMILWNWLMRLLEVKFNFRITRFKLKHNWRIIFKVLYCQQSLQVKPYSVLCILACKRFFFPSLHWFLYLWHLTVTTFLAS